MDKLKDEAVFNEDPIEARRPWFFLPDLLSGSIGGFVGGRLRFIIHGDDALEREETAVELLVEEADSDNYQLIASNGETAEINWPKTSEPSDANLLSKGSRVTIYLIGSAATLATGTVAAIMFKRRK